MNKLNVDWSKIPADFKFVAQDRDGNTYAYQSSPNPQVENGYFYASGDDIKDAILVSTPINKNWENTVTERPQ